MQISYDKEASVPYRPADGRGASPVERAFRASTRPRALAPGNEGSVPTPPDAIGIIGRFRIAQPLRNRLIRF